MKTIAIMNLKGGVGKTATAVNMAYILAQKCGYRVLVIDADGQRNATTTLVDESELGPTGLSDYLRAATGDGWRRYILPAKYRGIDVFPADSGLWDPALNDRQVPSYRLAELKVALFEADAYDTVIIDCPPAFPKSSINAAVAADVVVIPTTLDGYAISGADELVGQIDLLRAYAPDLRVGGILLTRLSRSGATMELERAIRSDGRLPVYDTVVSNSSQVPASTFARCPVADYAPHSWATVSYKRFVAEFIEREEAACNG